MNTYQAHPVHTLQEMSRLKHLSLTISNCMLPEKNLARC